MCGIAGGFGTDIDSNLLKRMCDKIQHRGPDDEGYHFEENVALGVRRLSIIDLETGGQPIHNEDETIWLVFNGEIFNYVELRQELEARHRFYTKSDTEVIVHLYEEMGERSLGKLNGMFAFALWDRNRRRLFLARDRVGVKPLYYTFHDGKLIFASEIKAILEAGEPAKPDRRAILDYMTLGYVLDDKTFFEGIKQLPAGHLALLENRRLEVKQYWDLHFKIEHRSESETIESLKHLIEDAVRIRLRSDVPLGCHLSGGIDSSLVTCVASQLLGGGVKTFTGAFNEGPDYDETRFAKIVAQHAGTEYHEVRPNGTDFIETLDRLIWYMDYPEVGPGIYPQYYVCRLAREHVKVILGGQGGDEVFAGYPWFVDVELEHVIANDKSLLRRLRAAGSYLKLAYQQGRLLPEAKRLFTRVLRDPKMEISERFYSDRALHSEEELSRMFTDAFRSSAGGYSPRESFNRIFNTATGSFMDKSQYYYIKTYLAGLLHVEDRTSMAVSLESRVPLCCDQNLVEFAASIDPRLRATSVRLKKILREAARGIIPDIVYARNDKKGFPTPYHIWLRARIQDVRRILLSEQAKARKVFDPAHVEMVIEEYESGKRSRAYTIFMMLCVELWFKAFIDQRRQERVQPALTKLA
jgi:asparagine synthase (glutamine-hydrolysing)